MALVLTASCSASEVEPLPRGTTWLAAVGAGSIADRHNYLIAHDGKSKKDIAACAGESDVEEVELSRDGRSLLLLGCWNASAPGGGAYALRAYVNASVVTMDSEASSGTWVNESQAVLGLPTGQVQIVDFAKSPPSVTDLIHTRNTITSLDSNPSGSKALIFRASSQNAKGASASIISLAERATSDIILPPEASAAFWMNDEQIVAQIEDEWLVVDAQTSQVIQHLPRSSAGGAAGGDKQRQRCQLVGSTSSSPVGWCPGSGEIVVAKPGSPALPVAKLSGPRLDDSKVSVASNNL